MSMLFIIYKIEIGTDLYIGSTNDFNTRKSCHKSHTQHGTDRKLYNTIRELGGWNNATMSVVEAYMCDNRAEAFAREEHWRQHYNASLNVRVAHIPYDDNTTESKKESLAAYHLQWRTANREKLREYHKKRKEDETLVNKQRGYAREHQRRIALDKWTNDPAIHWNDLLAISI